MNIPPELLDKYTEQQLVDAMVARLVGNVHEFTTLVREIDAMVQEQEARGDGFTPYPKLSKEFDAEATAVVQAGAVLVADLRRCIATVHELKTKAAGVRTRYEEYAKDLRAVLNTIEGSPRG